MTERSGQGDGPDFDPSVSNPTYIGTELAQRRAGGRDGDGTGGGFEPLVVRVSHLETRMDRMEAKLDIVVERLGAIATKSETRNYL